MTSVPKPLKFLRPHYHELETIYNKWLSSDDKVPSYLMKVHDLTGLTAMTPIESFCRHSQRAGHDILGH